MRNRYHSNMLDTTRNMKATCQKIISIIATITLRNIHTSITIIWTAYANNSIYSAIIANLNRAKRRASISINYIPVIAFLSAYHYSISTYSHDDWHSRTICSSNFMKDDIAYYKYIHLSVS